MVAGPILAIWLVFAILLPAAATCAHAQVSASAALDSDYRLRGYTLTDHRPALSLNLAYDHPSGAYLGGSAVAEEPEGSGARLLGHMEYIGYATRTGAGPSWDVGVSNLHMRVYGSRLPLRYTELYAGVSGEMLSAHVYYSPNYLRKGARSLYGSLDGTIRPAEHWRLFGHVGVFAPLGGGPPQANRRDRYDLRAGVAREFGRWELHMAWIALSPRPQPPTSQTRPGLVVGGTFFF